MHIEQSGDGEATVGVHDRGALRQPLSSFAANPEDSAIL